MEFNKWVTKWCGHDKFEDTVDHFYDLALEGLNGPDDMLSYMEEAFTAGVESTKVDWNEQ
jgi:hypothetical protein